MQNSSTTKSQNFGFTLIEAIVATAVFAFAMSAILGSFLSVMRINAKTRSIRTVEENARFITEFFTREIRNGVIDFGASGYNHTIPSQGRVGTLYLINRNGETERFSAVSGVIQLVKAGASTTLSGSDVIIPALNFYIRPTTQGNQELVTFSFQISSNLGSNVADKSSLTIQSSVAARDY